MHDEPPGRRVPSLSYPDAYENIPWRTPPTSGKGLHVVRLRGTVSLPGPTGNKHVAIEVGAYVQQVTPG
jgi:hypothetical protein